jgi:Rad3-related DNA helicase
MLKYEEQILKAFEMLGKSPRGNQLAQINEIITSYLDEGYKKIILNASTGAGKSIIGAVVAEVMHQLDPLTWINDNNETIKAKASFILMQNNVLTHQYYDTFKDNNNFLMIKGASNYPCHLLSTSAEPKTAEECVETKLRHIDEPELNALILEFCETCEFKILKSKKHRINHLITNYSYYFIDRLFGKKTPPRTITIWDEAHTINDVFAEHCAILITVKRLDTIAEELTNHLNVTDIKLFNTIKKLKDQIIKSEITELNYIAYLDEIFDLYKLIQKLADDFAKNLNVSKELALYTRITKLSKKYADMKCKISDLFSYEYEHIFEYSKEKQEISVKPIFVSRMFEQLINSPYQLFMSATVSKKLLTHTLGLNPSETKFIKLDPTFPIENKKIIFYGLEKLNYEKMKNPNTIKMLGEACFKLTEDHLHLGEKGIIMTPSFDVTEQICKNLKNSTGKIFEHRRGEKLAEVVRNFKSYKGASILVSPSLAEGISLDGDLSRFQILVKTPYPSLGDKRTKFICDNHKDLYSLATILKIVQFCGRSVRSEEDYATTYFLDQNLNWLWKSELNVWQSEFHIAFKQFI